MKSKYSAEEKFQIVMESFAGNVTQAEICRRHGIYPVQLIKWKGQFIQGGKSALAQGRNSDSRDEEIEDLKKIIGDQSLVIDAFKKQSREQDDGSLRSEGLGTSERDIRNITLRILLQSKKEAFGRP